MRRILVVLVAAFLLASASIAPAANITYAIVDYPTSQSDLSGGGIDHISGSITTDGVLGTLSTQDFLSASYTITTPLGSQYYTVNSLYAPLSGVVASPTSITIQPGAGLFLDSLTSSGSTELWYGNGYGGLKPEYFADYAAYGSQPQRIWDDTATSEAPPGIMSSSSWVAATAVPEPATLALLGAALLALGVMGIHRVPLLRRSSDPRNVQ